MTHALADVVTAEQFWISSDLDIAILCCPACEWTEYIERYTLPQLLAAARAHTAEAHHAAASSYADSYPALIPEAQLADDETTAAVRVCDATGNTVRGPLLPVELDGRRLWLCRVCFAAYRRSVSHLDDPLPLSEGPAL